MNALSTATFWLGLLSIPVALVVFFSQSQDMGIFVGHWPPTLLILSYILKQRFAHS